MALLDSVETCPPELEAELQQRIGEYLSKETAKVDQVAHVLSALEYEQRCAADEITRLQERKKAAAKAQERLEQYVCRVIKARGVKALKGKTNSLSVRPSDAVLITDERLVPLMLQTVTVKINRQFWVSLLCGLPDPWVERLLDWQNTGIIAQESDPQKASIKKALKAGEEIPGADLEFHDNLQRK